MKMEARLKFIYNMKKRIIPLLLISILASCSNQNSYIKREVFCFDTWNYIRLYDGKAKDADKLKELFEMYDALSDNYLPRDVNNVYTINNTHEEVEVSPYLFELLKFAVQGDKFGLDYFNPLCGSLAKKWKEAIEKKERLSQEVINEELVKMNNTTIEFNSTDGYKVKRMGDAELDLGGLIKGYMLDITQRYFAYVYLEEKRNIDSYIIDCGHSSIKLGRKNTGNGEYKVEIKDLPNSYLHLKNCCISTSGNLEQGQHIVNPVTGELADKYDTVIAITDNENGTYGDMLSTSLMNNTIEEIKELEKKFDGIFVPTLKTIVIKGGKVVYKHPDLKIYNS